MQGIQEGNDDVGPSMDNVQSGVSVENQVEMTQIHSGNFMISEAVLAAVYYTLKKTTGNT